MAQSFYVQKVNLEQYNIMILSANSLRVDDYLFDVVKELKKIRFKGSVLFDLLLSNGPSLADRFFSAFFDGKKFDISTFKNIKEIEIEAEKTSNSFYSTHLDLIDNSILTKPQKFLLKKKLERNLVI